MKKVLLVLFLCVVINSGKKVFNAGQILISELSNVELAFAKPGQPLHLNRETVFYILLLPNECYCP